MLGGFALVEGSHSTSIGNNHKRTGLDIHALPTTNTRIFINEDKVAISDKQRGLPIACQLHQRI